MTERTPSKLSLVIPLFKERSFLSRNSAILENLRKLTSCHDIDLFFCEAGESDDSCGFIKESFSQVDFNLQKVFFIQEEGPRASVGTSISLAQRKEKELGGHICVCPIDVLMSARALEIWFQKIPHSSVKYGAFYKNYEKTSRRDFAAFLLNLQRLYLNHWRLKVSRKFVWTNTPFFKKDLFLELITRDRGGFLEDVLMAQELRGMFERSTFQVIPGPVSVSSRRYLKRGVLKQMALNLMILLGFRLGVPQERLRAIYR